MAVAVRWTAGRAPRRETLVRSRSALRGTGLQSRAVRDRSVRQGMARTHAYSTAERRDLTDRAATIASVRVSSTNSGASDGCSAVRPVGGSCPHGEQSGRSPACRMPRRNEVTSEHWHGSGCRHESKELSERFALSSGRSISASPTGAPFSCTTLMVPGASESSKSEADAEVCLDVEATVGIKANIDEVTVQCLQPHQGGRALEYAGKALHSQDDRPHYPFIKQLALRQEKTTVGSHAS